MKTITILIPVFNEEERLEKTFEALSELQIPHGLKLEKVIFVNDGSDDKTVLCIKDQVGRIKKRLGCEVQIISYRKNKGKGYAISQGMKESTSDYTLFCDADMSTPMKELEKFVHHMVSDIPVIIGTRKNGHSTVVVHQPLYRELLGKGFTIVSNIALNTWVTDFTCGFKSFSREAKDVVFPKLTIDGWGFDSETMYLSKKMGFALKEVPVEWSDDKRSKVKIWKDLPLSILDLISIRINDMRGSYSESAISNPFKKPASAFLETINTLLF